MTPEEWDALDRKMRAWQEWKQRKDNEALAKEHAEILKRAKALSNGERS